MLIVNDIRQYFIQELQDENFTVDRTGQKTIELIGASFLADEEAIFGTPNSEYIDAELDWYLNCSTNINDIRSENGPPAAWKYAANEHGEINSNYGKLIFDDKYYRQFENVVNELQHNPDSRRACAVYNRPSIWTEFNENGKNDFICTNAVTYYIRDGHLQSVVQMRSNDVVFGYKNDYAWQRYVMDLIADQLNITSGTLHWQVQNLHVYERHFHLVK
ncbi:MAG: dCMP hydroxymethylase [Porticoccaceae bacterium]|nr:dCMP hydroxymethylase [Porticoccaceae bacterium]|tara:strand:- start:589 stop:1242 length:654 start_codon:yes stop_codon:yes gene_type:complete